MVTIANTTTTTTTTNATRTRKSGTVVNVTDNTGRSNQPRHQQNCAAPLHNRLSHLGQKSFDILAFSASRCNEGGGNLQ